VVFKVPGPQELVRRLANRPGKNIPADVMEKMITGFEPPSLDEGFKEIWIVGE
jgi:tRNA uridine 5-carbamoylmethylation protein Kti12